MGSQSGGATEMHSKSFFSALVLFAGLLLAGCGTNNSSQNQCSPQVISELRGIESEANSAYSTWDSRSIQNALNKVVNFESRYRGVVCRVGGTGQFINVAEEVGFWKTVLYDRLMFEQ